MAAPDKVNVFAGVLWPDGDGDIVANLQLARAALTEKSVSETTLIIDLKPGENTKAGRSVLGVVTKTIEDPSWTPDGQRRGVAHPHTVAQGPYKGLRVVLIDSRFDTDPALLPQADQLLALSIPSNNRLPIANRKIPEVIVRSAKRAIQVSEPNWHEKSVGGFFWRGNRPVLEFNSGFNSAGHYFFGQPAAKIAANKPLLAQIRKSKGNDSIPESFIDDHTRIAHSYFTQDQSTYGFLERLGARVAHEGDKTSPVLAFVKKLPETLPPLPANVRVVPYAPLPFETMEKLFHSSFFTGGTGDVSMAQMIEGGHFPFLYEVRSHKGDVAEQLRDTLVHGIEKELQRKLSPTEFTTLTEGLFIPAEATPERQAFFIKETEYDKARYAQQATTLATAPEFQTIREAGEKVVRTVLPRYSLPEFIFRSVLPLKNSINVDLLAHAGEDGLYGPTASAANTFFENHTHTGNFEQARKRTVRSLRQHAGLFETLDRVGVYPQNDLAAKRAENLQGLTLFAGAFGAAEAAAARRIAIHPNYENSTHLIAAKALALALFAEPGRADLVAEAQKVIASGEKEPCAVLQAALDTEAFARRYAVNGSEDPRALRSAAYYGLMSHLPSEHSFLRVSETEIGRRHAAELAAQVIRSGNWAGFVSALRGAPSDSLFAEVVTSLSSEDIPVLARLLDNPDTRDTWSRFLARTYSTEPALGELASRFQTHLTTGPGLISAAHVTVRFCDGRFADLSEVSKAQPPTGEAH